MSLENELKTRMKDAMKARDDRRVNVIRMVRAKLADVTNAKDFSGPVTDQIVLDVIAAYVKQLKKALPEYEKAGESGHRQVEALRFEIDYLSEFLPKLLDEGETRRLVDEAVQALPERDPKHMGRAMGAIMGAHKGRVDPALVKRLLEEALRSDA